MHFSFKKNIWTLLRGICILLIIASIAVVQPQEHLYQKGVTLYVNLFLVALLIFCELARCLIKNDKSCSVSLFVSMAAASGLYYYYQDYSLNAITVIYFILLLSDIIIIETTGPVFRKFLYFIHILLYVIYIAYSAYNSINSMFITNPVLAYTKDIIYLFNKSPLFKILLDRVYFIFFYLLFIFTFTQINQNMKVNKELRQANEKIKKLVLVNERHRLAQDIHDSMGHSLTALIMNLDFIEQIIGKESVKVKESLATCQELSRKVLTDVKKVVYSLKSNTVESNFGSSIKEMISAFTNTNELRIFFEYGTDLDNLYPDIKIILYRTIQEALTNAVKHAKASEVRIRFENTESHIRLIISDNGVGTKEIVKNNGLAGMEKRILSIGGSVEFSSDINKGFKIKVDVDKGV